MKYIIRALRDTYFYERMKYDGFNDLINMLEEATTNTSLGSDDEILCLLIDINESLDDINRPIQENVEDE